MDKSEINLEQNFRIIGLHLLYRTGREELLSKVDLFTVTGSDFCLVCRFLSERLCQNRIAVFKAQGTNQQRDDCTSRTRPRSAGCGPVLLALPNSVETVTDPTDSAQTLLSGGTSTSTVTERGGKALNLVRLDHISILCIGLCTLLG